MLDIPNGPTPVLSVDVGLPAPILIGAINAVEQVACRKLQYPEVEKTYA